MAYDFSKGSKQIREVGFLEGASGSKMRPTSPFSLESTKGLVSKYFDTTKDSIASGRLLDQLPSNNGTRRTGEEGRCVDLNGTNQAVRVADNTSLDITNNLTVTAWVKNDNATTTGEYILTKYDTGANKREWALGYNSSQKLLANIGSSDGSAFTQQTSDAAVSIDSWHHVAFTFYGGVVVLYVNGSLVASTESASHPASLNNEDADLMIGAGLNNNAILASWDGQIFDARIYAGDSTVLTAAQIAAIYADGPNNIQFDGQTLAAHYKLDRQSGTTCYDSSGNENHGTIENAASNWSVTHDILSFQNQVGYNVGRNAISNSEKFSSWSLSGGAAVNSGVTAGPDGLRLADRLNTASNPAYIYNSYYASGIVSGSKFTASVWVKADGNAGDKVRLRLSRAGSGTFEASSVQITLTDTWTRHKLSHTYANAQEAVRYDIGVLFVSDTAASCLIFGAQLDYGDTETEYQRTFSSGNYGSLLPRDENDPTNDVLGNPLTNIGRRPNDGKLNDSNCLTADGTLYIAAAHLAGTETVVSSGGTSTPSISAGRIDFTAGTCWDLTLSDGTHYPLSEGWGVDIGSSTSDNDGTLTDAVLANAWGATQDEYHYNILNGFSLYEHATTAAIRWPYKNGSVKTLTPPAGYSKTSDNPAGNYRNKAETTSDLNPDSTPEMGNIYSESVFNGSTSNGYVTNDSVLNFTDNLTVTCWAKSDLTDISSTADTLVSMYEDTGNLEVWRMEISADEKLRFQVGNSGGTGATIETADSAQPIDTWTHYAATFDGGVVKLYINGELQSSSESSAHATTLNGRSAPLVLGAYYWSGGGGSFQEWDGSLRNIRVYKGDSAPLSNSQIVRDLMETSSQPRFDGQTVVASYDLVKDTLDRSGNDLNAQNNNISFTKKTVPSALSIGGDLGEDGIVQKTVKFDSGEWGGVFDGSSYAIVKNREKLKIKEKPFSIECSVRTSDTGSNTILSKYQTSGNLRSYSLNIESGKIVFHSSSNGTAVVSSTGSDTINDGGWHKIKVVRESESGTSLKMYVDDVEDTGVGGSLAANFSENISNVAIGAYNTDATAANVFTGNIRELKVFTDDNIERASWELSKDTRDNTPNNYHGENNGITFLTPKQEYGYSISDSTPLAKQDQYLKEYHKSRLYL